MEVKPLMMALPFMSETTTSQLSGTNGIPLSIREQQDIDNKSINNSG